MRFQELIKLIYENSIPDLKKMLDKGVDFKITDPHDGNNILIAYSGYGYADHYTQPEMVRFLLSTGLDVNHRLNKRGDMLSALHMAVANGHLEIVKTLIEHKADVEIRDSDGNTPIWALITQYDGSEEQLQMIQLLLANGASVKTANDHGVAPISSIYATHIDAFENEHSKSSDLFFLLSEEDKKGISAYIAELNAFQILGDYYHEELKIRIKNGLDVNQTTEDDNTLLSVAAMHGHIKAVQLLLEHGAKTETRVEDGMTAIACAAQANVAYSEQWKCAEIVKLLIEHGADMHVKDNSGKTLLALAAENGRLETVELLLSKGLDVNAKDKKGNSVLDLAKKSFNKEYRKNVVAVLKKNGAA